MMKGPETMIHRNVNSQILCKGKLETVKIGSHFFCNRKAIKVISSA